MRWIAARITGLDADARQVVLDDGQVLAYDRLSLDVGSVSRWAGDAGSMATGTAAPGTAVDGIGAGLGGRVGPAGPVGETLPTPPLAVRPIDRFIAGVAALCAEPGGDVAVIGAGLGAVEVACTLATRLPADGGMLRLIGGPAEPLPGFPPALRRKVRAALAARGVVWQGDRRIVRIDGDAVVSQSGECWPARHVLLATGAAAPGWLASSGLACDDAGFVRVNQQLASTSHPDVFAAGDCAAHPQAVPRSGVYAVRAGPVLAHNLRAALEGGEPMPFRPQRNALYLLNLGRGEALATRNGLVAGGRWAWWLKDWIDRRFMRRFQLADVPADPAAAE